MLFCSWSMMNHIYCIDLIKHQFFSLWPKWLNQMGWSSILWNPVFFVGNKKLMIMNGKAKNNSILLDQKQNKKKNRTAAECLFVITFFLCDCHWFGFFSKIHNKICMEGQILYQCKRMNRLVQNVPECFIAIELFFYYINNTNIKIQYDCNLSSSSSHHRRFFG